MKREFFFAVVVLLLIVAVVSLSKSPSPTSLSGLAVVCQINPDGTYLCQCEAGYSDCNLDPKDGCETPAPRCVSCETIPDCQAIDPFSCASFNLVYKCNTGGGGIGKHYCYCSNSASTTLASTSG